MHAFCIPDMTTEKYKALEADVKGEWHCPTCAATHKVPPDAPDTTGWNMESEPQ